MQSHPTIGTRHAESPHEGGLPHGVLAQKEDLRLRVKLSIAELQVRRLAAVVVPWARVSAVSRWRCHITALASACFLPNLNRVRSTIYISGATYSFSTGLILLLYTFLSPSTAEKYTW